MGFLNSVRNRMLYYAPSMVFVAWDASGGSRKRKYLFKSYKAGRISSKLRDKKDADYQLAMLREYLELLGVKQRKVTGLEADDIIAHLCAYYKDEDKIIVSSDKDLLQLVNDKTKVYSLSKKKLYDAQQVIRDMGALPCNLVMSRAILGDQSDNIPGVRGIGEKSVTKLFPILAQEPATPEKLIEIAEAGEDRKHKLLLEQKDIFYRNIELMRLTLPEDKRVSSVIVEEIKRELKPKLVDFRIKYNRDQLPGDECTRLWAIFQRAVERQQTTEGEEGNVE